mmetsp:Transcript_40007/g.95768  ORF Transcript_40007/g.95768 Transcript_40007/m.95768 type:complete len:209 (-) Transcript_40007:946-1572(-)
MRVSSAGKVHDGPRGRSDRSDKRLPRHGFRAQGRTDSSRPGRLPCRDLRLRRGRSESRTSARVYHGSGRPRRGHSTRGGAIPTPWLCRNNAGEGAGEATPGGGEVREEAAGGETGRGNAAAGGAQRAAQGRERAPDVRCAVPRPPARQRRRSQCHPPRVAAGGGLERGRRPHPIRRAAPLAAAWTSVQRGNLRAHGNLRAERRGRRIG